MQDIEYLKSMYPSGIRILQGYVAEACDRLDYKNSPMYDEYPDHIMINRLCDTICDTVIASEGAEKVRGMWNISEHDKAVMEMAELKKDMKRLDVDFFTEDDDPVMEQEQNIENVPAENIGNAEVLTTEESLEEQSVSNSQNEFLGYRESVVNLDFREMEEWVDDLIWVRAQEDHPWEIIQAGRLWVQVRNVRLWGQARNALPWGQGQ